MPNEFVTRNGLIAQNNSTISGSLTVTGGITGSIASASYALTASYVSTAVPPFPFTGSAAISGDLSVVGQAGISVTGPVTMNYVIPTGGTWTSKASMILARFSMATVMPI